MISIILTNILKILALSNRAILNFKRNKSKSNINKREKKLVNLLRIRFILFFIIGFILLLFFWYYLAMFCTIYKNTQFHLLKDTIISFIISLIYPIILYLIPGIFRIYALSNRKMKRIYLYKFSKFMQFF